MTVPDSWFSHCSFADASLYKINPNQFRRNPLLPLPNDNEKKTFVESLTIMGGNGDSCAKSNLAVHKNSCTESMKE